MVRPITETTPASHSPGIVLTGMIGEVAARVGVRAPPRPPPRPPRRSDEATLGVEGGTAATDEEEGEVVVEPSKSSSRSMLLL